MEKRLIIGSDHAGFDLKIQLVKKLKEDGYEIEDIGAHSANSVDYPDYASALCGKIINKEYHRGILICGTGLGMSIAANKFREIRATVCESVTTAKLASLHNNSNVLCIGARILEPTSAFEVVDAWLNTKYEGGRHQKRLDMLANFQ